MRTVGIIVEYNPFHNGHLHHLEQAKQVAEADAVVAVMSGDFLQRGEPAIVSKWARAEMALHAGVDLVLELPSRFAVSAAERFAHGAIRALDNTGVVDAICFGSEHGQIEPFQQLAQQLVEEPAAFQAELNRQLDRGLAYPKAYAAAIQQQWPQLEAFDATLPNNTLGLFYTIALKRLNSTMLPHTIGRIASDYRSTDIAHASIASATALRALLQTDVNALEPYVPASTLAILKRCFAEGQGPVTWDKLIKPLLQQIAAHDASTLSQLCDIREGLEHRIKNSLYTLSDLRFSALVDTIHTKRYTKTHIQRVLTNILLQRKPAESASYLRVLGFTQRGQHILKRMRKQAKAPVITRLTQSDFTLLADDCLASYTHALGFVNPTRTDLRRELMQPPIQL
jgi:predicted nucleotidyltransferase